MIVSTTNTDKNYKVLEVIFAYGNSEDKFLKTANPLEAYPKVRDAKRRSKQT